MQYLSTDAAKLARITGVRSLVSEWQGRELVKSAAYPQLSENDQVQLANRKVAITLLSLQIDVWKCFSKRNRVRQRNIPPSLEAECMAANPKFGFFGLKISRKSLIALYFGPLMGGIGAHSLNFFGKWEFPVTR